MVNEGYSDKDLDVYFLPLDGDEYDPLKPALRSFIEEVFGPTEPIHKVDETLDPPSGGGPESFVYKYKLIGSVLGKRVDIFVL